MPLYERYRCFVSDNLKESLETKYWLSLLKDTEYITEKAFDNIHKDADEISKMLFSIIKSVNKNQSITDK